MNRRTRRSLLARRAPATTARFATYPAPGGTCTSSGGAIYEKTTSMNDIVFPSGQGTLRMLDAESPYIHNVSSTKQNLNTATGNGAQGLVLLAHNGRTARYWHHYEAPPDAVAPTASFTASPTSGTAPLSVAFKDTSAGSPTSWHWDLGNGATSTARHPATTYTAAGVYTVTLTARNAAGSSTATETITVAAAPALTASFTASPTSGLAPLSVAFTTPRPAARPAGPGTSATAPRPPLGTPPPPTPTPSPSRPGTPPAPARRPRPSPWPKR